MSKEAMKLALEALENLIKKTSGQAIYSFMETERRIAMAACVELREALASEAIEQKSGIKQVIELYDSPDQPAQQLTDERIFELASEHQDWDRNIRVRSFARAIEAAHGIKGDA